MNVDATDTLRMYADQYDRAGDFVALVRGRYLSMFVDLIDEALSLAFFAFFGGHMNSAYEPLERAVLDPMSTTQRVELLRQIVGHDRLEEPARVFLDGIGSAIECRDLFAHWSITYNSERSPSWEFILHYTRKGERRRFGATDGEIEAAFSHLVAMNRELLAVVTAICARRGVGVDARETPGG